MVRKPIFFATTFALAIVGAVAAAGAAPTQINACGTVSSPGSYVLSQSINATAAAADCLVITADFVTIDLAGHGIFGAGFVQPKNAPADGIVITSKAVTIRNGVVTGFLRGVHVTGLRAQAATIDQMRVAKNDFGILASGAGHIISNSVANNNVFDGINTGSSTVIHNNAHDNGGAGFIIKCPSVVVGNTSTGNVGDDFLYFSVADCAVSTNAETP